MAISFNQVIVSFNQVMVSFDQVALSFAVTKLKYCIFAKCKCKKKSWNDEILLPKFLQAAFFIQTGGFLH